MRPSYLILQSVNLHTIILYESSIVSSGLSADHTIVTDGILRPDSET